MQLMVELIPEPADPILGVIVRLLRLSLWWYCAGGANSGAGPTLCSRQPQQRGGLGQSGGLRAAHAVPGRSAISVLLLLESRD